MDKVSIVVPLYNRAARVNDIIAMVESQTYSNLELIIVDDGSNDDPFGNVRNSGAISVKFVRQENQGANSARNHGILKATGDYIALLDSDDYIYPEHIESSLKYLLHKPLRTIVYCQVRAIRGGGVQVIKPRRGNYKGENISEYLLCKKGFIQTSTLFARKEVFQYVGFDEALPSGQDTDFAIRASYHNYVFCMKSNITVDWDDEFDLLRISSTPHPEKRIAWLNFSKHMITSKAYKADRGWHYAKALYRKGMKGKFLSLYYFISAVFSRCYSPKMALEVFLQITISKKNYHRISDFLISRGVK